MPRRDHTNNSRDVEYIVKGSSPVYAALVIISFVMLLIAIVMQYIELTKYYDHPAGIFF